ncbi:MAG: PIN domain-containing protein [Syntrophobacteraceae bacterium]|nr:PIN domain-containing protein [Syntrophobacteraceae bacterium]
MLFDTNVVLDLLLDREPFSPDAARCFSMVEAGEIEGWLCASTLTTLHYLIRKSAGAKNALATISTLMSLFEVAPVNKAVLESALSLPFKDFEDAVLHEAARYSNVDVIITRNTADFKNSSIRVQLPASLLHELKRP